MNIIRTLLIFSCFLYFGCNEAIIDDTDSVDHRLSPDSFKKKESFITSDTATVFKVQGKKKIKIDGKANEWKKVPKIVLQKECLIWEGPQPINDEFDLSTYVQMLWDDDHLYVFAEIIDDTVEVVSDSILYTNGFEIYIDGNNSKIDGSDFDFSVWPPPYYTVENNTDFFFFSPFREGGTTPWQIIDVSTFESKVVLTDLGYNVELKIPFSSWPDFPGQEGHYFGVEFQVNDHEGGIRQHALKWASEIDNSYFNPALFGTAVLVDKKAK